MVQTIPEFGTEGTYDPDNLLVNGPVEHDTVDVTILSGQVLTRGAVLGQQTAGGRYLLSAAAAGDGSETPKYILAEDIDASGGDTIAPVYRTGGFNKRALTVGAGHTADSVADDLLAHNIYLYDSVGG